MQYQFKQACALGPVGEKKNFSCGVHEVEEKYETDSYFLTLVKCGLIVEADKTKLATAPVDPNERSKMLYDKLVKKPGAKEPKVEEKKEVFVPPTEAQAAETKEKAKTKKKD